MKNMHSIFAVAFVLCSGTLAQAQEEQSSTDAQFDQFRERMHALAVARNAAEAAKEQQFVDPLIRQAEGAVAKGKYSEAEKLYRRALATYTALGIHGELPEVSLPLAEVCDRLGKRREAIELYRDVVTDKPHFHSSIRSDPTTHMKFVLALARDHQWAEAANDYNKTMDRQTHHDDESTRFQRSLMSPEETAQYVERYVPEPLNSVRFDPEQPNFVDLQAAAHYLLGTKNPSSGGNQGEKEAHLKAAIRFRPRWALAHYTYGELLLTTSHGQEARQQFVLAAKLTDDPEMKKEASMKVSWLAPLEPVTR